MVPHEFGHYLIYIQCIQEPPTYLDRLQLSNQKLLGNVNDSKLTENDVDFDTAKKHPNLKYIVRQEIPV